MTDRIKQIDEWFEKLNTYQEALDALDADEELEEHDREVQTNRIDTKIDAEINTMRAALLPEDRPACRGFEMIHDQFPPDSVRQDYAPPIAAFLVELALLKRSLRSS